MRWRWWCSAFLVAVVGWGMRQTLTAEVEETRRPQAVMGTDCLLIAKGHGPARVDAALGHATQALRDVEAAMSSWVASTELSRLNRAEVGQEVPLSAATLTVLHTAEAVCAQTGGAFDPTCGPLLELWKQAGRDERLPSDEAVEAARQRVGFDQFELLPAGARKRSAAARLDLGGIAKGYGIDQAAETLQAGGCTRGLVDVGGDLRCFGGDSEPWPIELQSPFDESKLGVVELASGAVCTSGHYRRFQTIQGRQYSHIVDPRTGWPNQACVSVTVIAPSAMLCDAWATALCVLGPEGRSLLQGHELEALWVVGTPAAHEVVTTPGFPALQLVE